MKKINIFVLILGTTFFVQADIPSETIQKSSEVDPQEATPTLVTKLEQITNVYNEPEDPTDCTKRCGQCLVDCMACQSPDNLKKNFKHLNPRARSCFWHKLGIYGRREFLSNYSDEEWLQFYNQLSPEEQKLFASTIEQEKHKHAPEEKNSLGSFLGYSLAFVIAILAA